MAEMSLDDLACLEAAAALRAEGQIEAALAAVQALLARSPQLAVAYNYQGTLYHALQRYEEAVLSYQAAIKHQPDYLDAYYNLGLATLKQHDRVGAKRVFEVIVSLSPIHVGARFQLGRLAMEASQYDVALPLFQALVQDYPEHLESAANLAACYLRTGQIDAAREAYEAVIALDARDTQALFNLGVIHSHQGRDDLARLAYLKVLAINPLHADAHVNLGALYWKARLQTQALEHYREARRLRPDDILIEHALRVVGGDTSLVEATPEYTRALFNAYAPTYDDHLLKVLHYAIPSIFQKLLSETPAPTPCYQQVLDLGCGTGLCAPVLRPLAKVLVGVDLASAMVDQAREKGLYDDLVVGEAYWYLSTKTAAYDLIVAGDVFVYIGDLAKLMGVITTALTAEGRLLFNVESGLPGSRGFGLEASGRFKHDPAYLNELARTHGFRVLVETTLVLREEASQPVMGCVCLWEKIVR